MARHSLTASLRNHRRTAARRERQRELLACVDTEQTTAQIAAPRTAAQVAPGLNALARKGLIYRDRRDGETVWGKGVPVRVGAGRVMHAPHGALAWFRDQDGERWLRTQDQLAAAERQIADTHVGLLTAVTETLDHDHPDARQLRSRHGF